MSNNRDYQIKQWKKLLFGVKPLQDDGSDDSQSNQQELPKVRPPMAIQPGESGGQSPVESGSNQVQSPDPSANLQDPAYASLQDPAYSESTRHNADLQESDESPIGQPTGSNRVQDISDYLVNTNTNRELTQLTNTQLQDPTEILTQAQQSDNSGFNPNRDNEKLLQTVLEKSGVHQVASMLRQKKEVNQLQSGIMRADTNQNTELTPEQKHQQRQAAPDVKRGFFSKLGHGLLIGAASIQPGEPVEASLGKLFGGAAFGATPIGNKGVQATERKISADAQYNREAPVYQRNQQLAKERQADQDRAESLADKQAGRAIQWENVSQARLNRTQSEIDRAHQMLSTMKPGSPERAKFARATEKRLQVAPGSIDENIEKGQTPKNPIQFVTRQPDGTNVLWHMDPITGQKTNMGLAEHQPTDKTTNDPAPSIEDAKADLARRGITKPTDEYINSIITKEGLEALSQQVYHKPYNETLMPELRGKLFTILKDKKQQEYEGQVLGTHQDLKAKHKTTTNKVTTTSTGTLDGVISSVFK